MTSSECDAYKLLYPGLRNTAIRMAIPGAYGLVLMPHGPYWLAPYAS